MAVKKKPTEHVPDSLRKKISAAMKGKKNAEKWEESLVKSILNKMVAFLDFHKENNEETVERKSESLTGGRNGDTNKESQKLTNVNIHLKSEILILFKIGNRKWFSYMAAKFAEKDSEGNDNVNYSSAILTTLELIDMTCEVNTYKDAARGSVVPAIAAMNLAKNYGYATSKVDASIKHEGGVNVSIPEPSDSIKDAFESARNIDSDD